jgi:RimJ/RimL family protein N-acetyltransferase
MITLRPSIAGELEHFVEFEREQDTSEFIIPYSLSAHEACFREAGIRYLSITEDGKLVGFVILCIEGSAVEFRRIVITRSARGIGQQVIRQMHKYCVSALGVRRVWLDVFAHNKRGRHLYAKLGYKVVNRKWHEGRELIIMERRIGTGPEGDSALRQPTGGPFIGS